MQAEARIAARLGWPVAIGGGTAARAEAVARRLAREGVTDMVSVGLAGGLDPSLPPGTVIVPAGIVADGRVWPTDPGLNARLGGAGGHLLLGARTVAATADEKQALWQATGAAAVDLESAAVARHAQRFAALRVICDPADCDLPPAALAALGPGGAIGLLRVLASVLRRPWQVPALLRLAADAKTARGALVRRLQAVAD
jgi:adenosylhomocysteine nucleosidase